MSLIWSSLPTRKRGVRGALVPFIDCGVTYGHLRRHVRGFTSHLRRGCFPGHCTSASAMERGTSTHTNKKSNQEAKKTNRSRERLALLLLPAANAAHVAGRVHEAPWITAGFDEAISMHGGAHECEMRWRQGHRGQHLRRMPVLQPNAPQGEHPLDAIKHASVVRSRMAKGKWHPPQVNAIVLAFA